MPDAETIPTNSMQLSSGELRAWHIVILATGTIIFFFLAQNWWWIAYPKPSLDGVTARVAAALPPSSENLPRQHWRQEGATTFARAYSLGANRKGIISVIGADNTGCVGMDPEGLKQFQIDRNPVSLIGRMNIERIRGRSVDTTSSPIRAWHSFCYKSSPHLVVEVSGEGEIEAVRALFDRVDLDRIDALRHDFERLHRQRSWPATLFPD